MSGYDDSDYFNKIYGITLLILVGKILHEFY
jgi:hypothetical protein